MMKYLPTRLLYFLCFFIFFSCTKDESSTAIPDILESDGLFAERIEFGAKNKIPNKIFYTGPFEDKELQKSDNLPQTEWGILEVISSDVTPVSMLSRNYLNTAISSHSSVLALTTFSPYFTELSTVRKKEKINEIVNHRKFQQLINTIEKSERHDLFHQELIDSVISFRRNILDIEDIESDVTKSEVDENPSGKALLKLPYELTGNETNLIIESKVKYHLQIEHLINDKLVFSEVLRPKKTLELPGLQQNALYQINVSYIGTNAQLEDYNMMLRSLLGFLVELIGLPGDCIEFWMLKLSEKINFTKILIDNNHDMKATAHAVMREIINTALDVRRYSVACNSIEISWLGKLDILISAYDIVNDFGKVFFTYPFYKNVSSQCFYLEREGFVNCNQVSIVSANSPSPHDKAQSVQSNGAVTFQPGGNTPINAYFELHYTVNQSSSEKITLRTNSWNNDFPKNAEIQWRVDTIGSDGALLALGETWTFTTGSGDTPPTVNTKSITNVTKSSAMVNAEVTNSGGSIVTTRGVVWSTNPSPSLEDNKTDSGNGTGAYAVLLENLKPNTTYYVLAYAQNEKGLNYGAQLEFVTGKESVNTPVVKTNAPSQVSQTSAVFSGEVSEEGGAEVTSRGFVWGTNENPTLNDTKSTNGTGLGNYNHTVNNLDANTTYWVKAYAVNEQGVRYGSQNSFTTSAQPLGRLEVSTKIPASMTTSSAIVGGSIVSDGGKPIQEKGVCWGKDSDPDINDNRKSISGGADDFLTTISNLNSDTDYHVRAYAVNSEGVIYGEDNSFRTLTSSAGFSDIVVKRVWLEEENDGSWEINVEIENIGDTKTPDNEDVKIAYLVNGEVVGEDVSRQLDPGESDKERLDNFTFTNQGANKVIVVVPKVSNEQQDLNNLEILDFYNEGGQSDATAIIPTNLCTTPAIMEVGVDYEVNLTAANYVNNYSTGVALDNDSYRGGDVRGMWLAVRVPAGYYAREIKVFDVSSNFDPVVALRSNCNFDYYPNANSSGITQNSSGNGGNETFGTGISGPDSQGDGIYHIRLYHYNGTETPAVNFKIRVE